MKSFYITFPTLLASLIAVQPAIAETINQSTVIEGVNFSETPKIVAPSLFDQGKAFIMGKSDSRTKAVKKFRQLHSQTPTNRHVRFQMAMALMANEEFEAAKDQLQKLRATSSSIQEIAMLDNHLDTIEKRDDWGFSGSASYSANENINSAAPLGYKLTHTNGAVLTDTVAPIEADGFSYSVGVDKKWATSELTYVGLDGGVSGTLYPDESNYNDLTAKIGVGYGMRTLRSSLEIMPYIEKNFQGTGENDEAHFQNFSVNKGVKLSGNHWINPALNYEGTIDYSKASHIDKFDHLDGSSLSASNTLLYAGVDGQLIYGGLDADTKSSNDDLQDYDRYGVRLGLQKEWGYGISNSVDLGYAKLKVKGVDSNNIKRTDDEYSASVSLWNRNWYWRGITPKVTLSHTQTESNKSFYDKKDNKAFLEFSSTF